MWSKQDSTSISVRPVLTPLDVDIGYVQSIKCPVFKILWHATVSLQSVSTGCIYMSVYAVNKGNLEASQSTFNLHFPCYHIAGSTFSLLSEL